MIETEQQRRWWFATHPEFSAGATGQRGNPHDDDDDEEDTGRPSPEAVDAAVDERLEYERDNVRIALLEGYKKWFGTEFQSKKIAEKEAMLREDEDLPETDRERKNRTNESEYQEGWNDGYSAIHSNKAPPDLLPSDKSPYAQGVREGATAALDEKDAWVKKWLEPIWMLLGTHPSTKLGNDLKAHEKPKPPGDYDAHHLVPWDHWRAEPARDILKYWDIKIDSYENGMWLYRPYHHRLSNNYRYIDTVFNMLNKATSREEAVQTLRQIERLLSTRKFPL